jgi:hypothetical protein
MYEEISDATIGSVIARAARYPAVTKSSQARIVMKGSIREPVRGDPGIRWLVVNTMAVNRHLTGTI